MANIQFGNICVNKTDKTFTIVSGSSGEYDYRDVMACSILYEEDRYKDKSPMFSHSLMRGSILHNCLYIGNVWCGLRIELFDGQVLYAYMSKQATQYNSLQFHEDTRNCEAFINYLLKHRVHFKNIYFNTDKKEFTIYKGSVGTYSYVQICKCKVEIEYENWYGDIEHLAQYSMQEANTNASIKVYLYMKDDTVLEAYVSNKPIAINSKQFHVDQMIAKDMRKFVLKIIKKYNPK